MRGAGHVVIDPWELGDDLLGKSKAGGKSLAHDGKLAQLSRTNNALGRTNQMGIDKSEIVVAALDGPDVDSGTASEIGYAFAKGKTILGYRGDLRLTGENAAACVNLQVQYWIEESGGRIVRSTDSLLGALEEVVAKRPSRPSGVE
jgi:nucleoside 2-deoxyribosyltransferase